MLPVPLRYAGVYPPSPASEWNERASAVRSSSYDPSSATAPPLLTGNWNSSHSPALSRNASALSSTVSAASVTPLEAVDSPLTISPSPRFTYIWTSANAMSTASIPSSTSSAPSSVPPY